MTEKYEDHPLAAIFPLFSEKELADLTADIKQNGLEYAILLYEGKILDGRNRYRACLRAGVEVRTKEYRGNDPISKVISRNAKRRNSNESQRAISAARLANMGEGKPVTSQNWLVSQQAAADMMNVSVTLVQYASALIKAGKEDALNAIEFGEATLLLYKRASFARL